MGAGADLSIGASGAHVHAITDPGHTHEFLTDSARNIAGLDNCYQGATQVAKNAINSATTGISINSATHSHASGDFAGRIGLVTGGVNGNSAMTSGSANHACFVRNWIMKVQNNAAFTTIDVWDSDLSTDDLMSRFLQLFSTIDCTVSLWVF